MPYIKSQMTALDVIEIVHLFKQHDIEIIIDGGWGVDALIGKQTREHEDLDVAVEHKHIASIRDLLETKGFKDVPRDDSWECNFVLGDDKGHLVDIHSFTFDENGEIIFGLPYPLDSLNGSGSIYGYQVRCITPEWMVKFHSGYELDEIDYHDVTLLCQQFGIQLPQEYFQFIQVNPSDLE